MDALNVLGLAAFGEADRSREGLAELAVNHQLDIKQLAQAAVDAAVEAIGAKMEALVRLVNTKPVYTIHEILEDRHIAPTKLIVIGGPAAVFKDLLAARLGLEVIVPPLHAVANAIGAGLTRTTSHLTLTADTARGRLAVPMLGIFRSISRTLGLDEVIAEAKNLLVADLGKAGVSIAQEDVQITQADSFNMVDGGYTSGKNIRVVAQVRPAVVGRLDAPPVAIRHLGQS
jgi:hypothetical protein